MSQSSLNPAGSPPSRPLPQVARGSDPIFPAPPSFHDYEEYRDWKRERREDDQEAFDRACDSRY